MKRTIAIAIALLLLALGGFLYSARQSALPDIAEPSNSTTPQRGWFGNRDRSVTPPKEAIPPNPDEKASRHIVGRVEDAQTHRPIAGASVLLEVDGVDLGETPTLEDGTFGVPLATFERVWARVRADGYAPTSASCFDATPCTIGLDAGVEIAGSVLEPGGIPVAGARVSCRAGHQELRAATTSAADGSFALAACPIEWLQLVAEHDRYGIAVLEVDGRAHGDRVELTLLMLPGARVTGIVREGEALANGAEVLAIGAADLSPSVRTVSGGDGRFDLGLLPAGPWTIAAMDAIGRVTSVEVAIAGTEPQVVEVTLPPVVSLTGTVRVDGAPVAGAMIELWKCRPAEEAELPLARVRHRHWEQRHGTPPEWNGTSGPDGTFRIATGGAARCFLDARHPDAGQRVMRVDSDAHDVSVDLARGARLTGVVHGANGRVADVEGTAHVLALVTNEHGRRAQATVPVRHGAFDAGRLPPGSYEVKIQLAAMTGPPPEIVEIAQSDLRVVLVRPGGTVKGRVVDDTTSAPVPAAHVDLGGFLKDGVPTDIPVSLMKTDAEGRFTIEGADPTMWLRVHRPGYGNATLVTVEELVPGSTLDIGDIPVRR